MTSPLTQPRVDLRRATLGDLRAIDFRSPERDYWADESAIHERFLAVWAGLDDAAWRLPGAAPSDAGGPDWSLLDHVGHVIDWWEMAAGYIGDVAGGAEWPSDEDFYAGGDFNALNERRRSVFAGVDPRALRGRGVVAHARVLAVARRLPLSVVRSDAAWGWVHQVLHGHEIDHLAVLEPWADALRTRQIGNDPFGADPQPTRADLDAGIARFWTSADSVLAAFDELLTSTAGDVWTKVSDGTWTLADHVAHLASWFVEGSRAVETHRAGGPWADLPPDGVDAFNARRVGEARGTPPADLRRAYDDGLARLRSAIEAMTEEEWLDPEGFSWAYEDLHGHVRAHHAMIGPAAARLAWSSPADDVAGAVAAPAP